MLIFDADALHCILQKIKVIIRKIERDMGLFHRQQTTATERLEIENNITCKKNMLCNVCEFSIFRKVQSSREV